MLWIGWFGFNSGSAIASGFGLLGLDLAANAALNTHICASTAAFMWMLTEWIFRRRPSVLGLVNGAVAGLVLITPGIR